MNLSRKVAIPIALAVLMVGAVSAYHYWKSEYGPLDEGRFRTSWEATWSGPRYTRAECIVRIDVELGLGHEEAWNQWHQTFTRYVHNHEPRALFDAGNGREGEIYLQFFDECDRRYEIARKLVDYFGQRHGDRLKMTVRDSQVAPGPDTIEYCGRQWTDCKGSR